MTTILSSSITSRLQSDSANRTRSPFSSKNTQECRCGAASCRGILGPKPKTKEIRDILQPPLHTNGKRKRQGSPSMIPDVVPTKRQRPATACPNRSTTSNLPQPCSNMAGSVQVMAPSRTRASKSVCNCVPRKLKVHERQQDSLIYRARNQIHTRTGHTIRRSSGKVSGKHNPKKPDRPVRRGSLQSTADTVRGKVDWKP